MEPPNCESQKVHENPRSEDESAAPMCSNEHAVSGILKNFATTPVRLDESTNYDPNCEQASRKPMGPSQVHRTNRSYSSHWNPLVFDTPSAQK